MKKMCIIQEDLNSKRKLLTQALKAFAIGQKLKLFCNYFKKEVVEFQPHLEIIMKFNFIYENRFIKTHIYICKRKIFKFRNIIHRKLNKIQIEE